MSEHAHRLGTGLRDEHELVAQAQALGRTVSTVSRVIDQEGESLVFEFSDGVAVAVDAMLAEPGVVFIRTLNADELSEVLGE